MQAPLNQGEEDAGGYCAGFAFPRRLNGDSWRCGVCSAQNGPSSSTCAGCMAFRPQDVPAADDEDHPFSEGLVPSEAHDPDERTGGALGAVRGAGESLRAELARSDLELRTFVERLDAAERRIEERYETLESRKASIEEAHGDPNASEDDVVEINAGGKIVSAKRRTLCQMERSYLGAIFSGRWDRKLQRDRDGRIFLDVNPKCFLAIVDYLNYLKLCSAENPDPPSVNGEYHHLLMHQIKLFGIEYPFAKGRVLDSNIIRNQDRARLLHRWLDEDGSDGDLRLLYRSTRDGASGQDFHRCCDNKGCTMTVIETTQGLIMGGYSNAAWGPKIPSGFAFGAPSGAFDSSASYAFSFGRTSSADSIPADFGSRPTSNWNRNPTNMDMFKSADKAFLFVFALDGTLLSKMEVEKPHKAYAICSQNHYGPTFGSDTVGTIDPFGPGHDLHVRGSRLYFSPGNTYYDHSRPSRGYGSYHIRELEVFQVLPREEMAFCFPNYLGTAENHTPAQDEIKESITISETNSFAKSVNDALNFKLKALKRAEEEISVLERNLRNEENFIDSFASGDEKDVIALNVSGTTMTTERSTLRVFEESVLARRFDDTTWTEQGKVRLKEWTHENVSNWIEQIDGISSEVVSIFKENEITGRELTALGFEGLKMLGVERTGTLCLLLDEIKKLEKASQDVVPLIEHSPYCFGKILDYLRLKRLHVENVIESQPLLPNVRDSEKNRFEMTVNYFFPGESARLILG